MIKRIDSKKIQLNNAGEAKKVIDLTGEICKVIIEKGTIDPLAEIKCYNSDEETLFNLKELSKKKTIIYPHHSIHVSEQVQLEGAETDTLEHYFNEGPLYIEIINGGENKALANISFVIKS